jgi:hypothetical protein
VQQKFRGKIGAELREVEHRILAQASSFPSPRLISCHDSALSTTSPILLCPRIKRRSPRRRRRPWQLEHQHTPLPRLPAANPSRPPHGRRVLRQPRRLAPAASLSRRRGREAPEGGGLRRGAPPHPRWRRRLRCCSPRVGGRALGPFPRPTRQVQNCLSSLSCM